MLSIGIFFFAAFVIKPRRSEWPAKSPTTPAIAQRRRRIRATSPGSSRQAVRHPRKSNVRKMAAVSRWILYENLERNCFDSRISGRNPKIRPERG